MMSEPKRDDAIYQEIESFADYELTNCIAYEMAIRNDEVQQLILEFKKLPYYEDKTMTAVECQPLKELIEQKLYYKYFITNSVISNNPIIEYTKMTNSYGPINVVKDVESFVKYGCLFSTDKYDKPIIDVKKLVSFKRPRLEAPPFENRNINLQVNLALPKDELVAYIEKIKDDFDEDNAIVKTPFEALLGETIKSDENNPLINKKTNKIDKAKVATMFFIYDAVKAKLTKSDTMQAIDEYNYDKFGTKTAFDRKTLNKLLRIAESFIDNLQYKKLIH